jgi:hypothetical protein
LIFLLPIFVAAGFVLGYFFTTRKKKQPFFASAEYWVFLPESKMPDQDEIMTTMISRNPYSKRGQSPIGPPEGLIFSDVRLHIALVLRAKNPHAFRPYIFEDVDEMNRDTLVDLEGCQAFVKLRYISEDPLKDKRHLQFLIHAADAVARLGASPVIYDHVSAVLYTPSRLAELLSEHFNATNSDVHVRTRWIPHSSGGHLETKGMVKVGLPEIKTDGLEADQQLLARAVLDEAIAKTWEHAAIPDPWEVEAYGDRFQILPAQPKNRTTLVRILRIQSV